jgi:hypothetical protein
MKDRAWDRLGDRLDHENVPAADAGQRARLVFPVLEVPGIAQLRLVRAVRCNEDLGYAERKHKRVGRRNVVLAEREIRWCEPERVRGVGT